MLRPGYKYKHSQYVNHIWYHVDVIQCFVKASQIYKKCIRKWCVHFLCFSLRSHKWYCWFIVFGSICCALIVFFLWFWVRLFGRGWLCIQWASCFVCVLLCMVWVLFECGHFVHGDGMVVHWNTTNAHSTYVLCWNTKKTQGKYNIPWKVMLSYFRLHACIKNQLRSVAKIYSIPIPKSVLNTSPKTNKYKPDNSKTHVQANKIKPVDKST